MLFLFITQIKYDENLPKVVCHVCLYKLEMWHEFKERFIQSNKVLLEQLEISDASDDAVSRPNDFLLCRLLYFSSIMFFVFISD